MTSPTPNLGSRLIGLARSFLRSNAAIYLGGSVLARLGAIILIPMYTRRLTLDEYGEYAVLVSVLQILPHCFSFGLSAGIARVFFAEKDPVEARRKMGAVARGMIVIVLGMGLLSVIALRLFAPPTFLGMHARLVTLIAIASTGAALALVPELYYRSAQQPRPVVALQVTSFASVAGLGLLFVLGFGRRLNGVVEAVTCSSVLMGTIAVLFIRLRLPSTRDIGSETKKAILFSLPLVPNVLAYWAQLTADRWILNAYGATAALGAYYLAMQLLSPIMMVTSAWNDAQAAKYGELYREHGAMASYKALGSYYRSYALVTLVPTIGLLVGSPLFPIVIGPKFLGAIAIMPVLGAGYVADAFYYPAANYLFYIGKTTLIPISTVTTAVLTTILAILLLPRFGLAGLVACRFLGSLIRACAMILAARINKPPPEALTAAAA